jgi:hypothetical protein
MRVDVERDASCSYDVSSTLFVRALTVTGVGKELDAIVPTGG